MHPVAGFLLFPGRPHRNRKQNIRFRQALLLVISLTACGGGNNNTSPGDSSNLTDDDSSTPPSVSGEINSAATSDNGGDKGARKDGLNVVHDNHVASWAIDKGLSV